MYQRYKQKFNRFILVTLCHKDAKSNSVKPESNVHLNKTLPTRSTSSSRTKFVIGPERVIWCVFVCLGLLNVNISLVFRKKPMNQTWFNQPTIPLKVIFQDEYSIHEIRYIIVYKHTQIYMDIYINTYYIYSYIYNESHVCIKLKYA